MFGDKLTVSGAAVVLGSALFAGGCGQEKPIPASLDALLADDSGSLVGQVVALEGKAQYQSDVAISVSVPNSTLVLPRGKSFAIITRKDTVTEETWHRYDITLTGDRSSFVLSDVDVPHPLGHGKIHVHVIGRFEGLHEDGSPMITLSQVLPSSK